MQINELELISIRRDLHAIPELSFKEFKTKAYLIEKLNAYGIAYETIGETGLLAKVEGKHPKGRRVLGIRCDMDALPIEEQTGLVYQSKHEGCMHACGHDAHMAMQLMVAKWFQEHQEAFGGTIKFIFQPAEEYVRGAKGFIESGQVADVESFFGMHIWSDLPVGKVNVESGPRMGSIDMFRIRVKGKGGHGSAPHQAVDALIVAAQILLSLQTYVSREISPMEQVVLSVGKLEGGTAANIIAETAVLEGNIRGFNNALRSTYKDMLERIATHIAAAYRAEAEVEFYEGSPVLMNDQELTQLAQQVVNDKLGEGIAIPFERIAASEDFAEFSLYRPSVYAFVGCRNEAAGKCYPHHNPKFDIDEAGMLVGTRLAIEYALAYLER